MEKHQTFSEWLSSIHGTEKEARLESAVMEAERQREVFEDIMWELHWERGIRNED